MERRPAGAYDQVEAILRQHLRREDRGAAQPQRRKSGLGGGGSEVTPPNSDPFGGGVELTPNISVG